MVRPSKSLPSCASSVAQWQQRPRRLPGCRLFPMFWTHLNFARPCGEALESLRNHFCDIVTHLQERMCSVSIAPKPLLRPDESREVQPLQLQRLQQHSMVPELPMIRLRQKTGVTFRDAPWPLEIVFDWFPYVPCGLNKI